MLKVRVGVVEVIVCEVSGVRGGVVCSEILPAASCRLRKGSSLAVNMCKAVVCCSEGGLGKGLGGLS
jgi:hypothetical protein